MLSLSREHLHKYLKGRNESGGPLWGERTCQMEGIGTKAKARAFLKERADPVRDGEVWLLGERAQGRLRVETERLLQTPW